MSKVIPSVDGHTWHNVMHQEGDACLLCRCAYYIPPDCRYFYVHWHSADHLKMKDFEGGYGGRWRNCSPWCVRGRYIYYCCDNSSYVNCAKYTVGSVCVGSTRSWSYPTGATTYDFSSTSPFLPFSPTSSSSTATTPGTYGWSRVRFIWFVVLCQGLSHVEFICYHPWWLWFVCPGDGGIGLIGGGGSERVTVHVFV